MNRHPRLQDILFRGLQAPLRLDEADRVLPVLRAVAEGWPFADLPPSAHAKPFYRITGVPDQSGLSCECHVDDRPRRMFDAVNAVCDAVSALPLALAAERPELICLHAAGVSLGGRLVIFPNIRRAGKSTLTSALAQAGCPVFSDDVVPVCFTPDGEAHGVAMGIAPRLRLPLPETLGSSFLRWVETVAGPANRQYRYLRLKEQPEHGATLPVGAFVILDRCDGECPASLARVSPDAAMDALLFQNFTRDRHSADILRMMAVCLERVPVFRLTYSDLSGAVGCLKERLGDARVAPTGRSPEALVRFRLAEEVRAGRRARLSDASVRQRVGCVSAALGETMYLADPEGRAIHRLDAMTAAIWAVVEEPITVSDLIGMMVDAFPDTPADQVTADIMRLLSRLQRLGLIEAERSA